jgi:seryl-tRNA(Sec) selenium transferase
LRVEELVLQCLEGLVVALELYLQRSIRDARAATQELHRTIDDLLKPHDSYSDRRWD